MTSEYEPVGDTEEVVAKPEPRVSRRELVEEAGSWWTLPADLGALEEQARSWGRYGTCLVEMREWLRKTGRLYPELARDIAKELRYVRAHLYAIGLRVLALAGSCERIESDLLRRVCEYAEGGVPRYVWRVVTSGSGAKRPDIILYWLCKFRRECCPIEGSTF